MTELNMVGFSAKMGRDGRIVIPKLQRKLLTKDEHGRYILAVALESA